MTNKILVFEIESFMQSHGYYYGTLIDQKVEIWSNIKKLKIKKQLKELKNLDKQFNQKFDKFRNDIAED